MSLDITPALSELMPNGSTIAVLSPHPDDESLACGALLACAFATNRAHVICLTDGSASHPNSVQWPASKLASCRRSELEAAIGQLGGSSDDITWMGLPDSGLHQLDPFLIASDLLAILDACDATHVFAPSAEDHHEDHKVTSRVADELQRLRPDLIFYSYPVWSRWDDPEFEGNVIRHKPIHLEPGDWRERKRAAIGSHLSQFGLVVSDDPEGFVLPTDFVEKFVNENEIFWRRI